MRQSPDIEHGFIRLQNLHIAFRKYRFPASDLTSPADAPPRKLLCLHGAGVAGDYTYGYIAPFLKQWSEVLVPDLRGMGETVFLDECEHAFDVEDLVDDVEQLLSSQNWDEFDVIGYSLGGLVSMMLKQRLKDRVKQTCLVEPALLDNFSLDETRNFRRQYRTLAKGLKDGMGVRESVIAFLDLVSPNRSRQERSENIVIGRLSHRPLGFANALEAVSLAAERLDRDALIQDQENVISLVGGNSYEAMKLFHSHIASTRPDWRYLEVPGADHSLPFQKPKRLISLLNALPKI